MPNLTPDPWNDEGGNGPTSKMRALARQIASEFGLTPPGDTFEAHRLFLDQHSHRHIGLPRDTDSEGDKAIDDDAVSADERVFGGVKSMSLGRAASTPWPAPQYILGPLQAGDVGLLSGADGVGKSWVGLAAAVSVAYGKAACGGAFEITDSSRGPVVYFAVEDREADHGRRLAALARHVATHDQMRIDDGDDLLTIIMLEGKRQPLVTSTAGKCSITQYGKAWAKAVADYRLVIIDPLRAFHDLQESDGQAMDFLIRWLVTVAMTNWQAILLVHHASQGAILEGRDDHHAGRGATDLPAGCRAVWIIRAASKEEVDEAERRDWRVLVNAKASHGPEATKRFLHRGIGGVLYVDPSGPPSPPKKEKDQKPEKKSNPTPAGGVNAYQAAKDGRDVW
jgi:hypothetical protein